MGSLLDRPPYLWCWQKSPPWKTHLHQTLLETHQNQSVKPMTEEKILTIPLRRHFRIYPRWRRTKIAVRATRAFLIHHLKTDQVSLGKYLNLALHSCGRKRPPHHIQVKVWKDKDTYKAEIIGAPVEEKPTPQEQKQTKLEEKIKTTQKIQELRPEPPAETQKEKLEEEKKEILKREVPPQPVIEKPEKEKRAKDLKQKESPGMEKIKRLKKQFTKTQKPSHETRLSKKK